MPPARSWSIRAAVPSGPVSCARPRFASGGSCPAAPASRMAQGGQVRQDLVLADVGVLRPGRVRARGAGVAVAAPVGGLAVGPGRFHPPPAPPAGQQPGQQVPARRRARAGPRGAARVLGGDEVGLADQRRVRRVPGDDPAVGQVPPLHLPVPQGRCWPGRPGRSRCAAGSTPAGPCTGGWPGSRRPCRSVQPARSGAGSGPGRPPTGTAPRRRSAPARSARRCARPAAGRTSTARPAPSPGRAPAGARAVPTRRAPCSGAARRRPSRYPYGGRPPRYRPCSRVWAAIAVRTRILVRVISRLDDSPSAVIVCSSCSACAVDPAADLRHPQLHAVVLEQRRHRRVLAAVERPLVLPDHDRVPPPVRVRQLRDQRGGLRAPRPRQRRGSAPRRRTPPRSPRAPRTSASACSRCRARDVTGSCQSSVDTRP